MNRTQTQILTLIATLPIEQRRELVEDIYDVDLFSAGFADRLTPAQEADLEEHWRSRQGRRRTIPPGH